MCASVFQRFSKTLFSYCFRHPFLHTHDLVHTRAREREPRVIPKNVIIGNEGEKRKIFFLNLTTNKTRSTASNDWLKRDGDVEVHRGGA